MAVNYTPKKITTVRTLQEKCISILQQINDAMELRQQILDNGFQPGGAFEITNTELNEGANPPFPHITTSDLTAAVLAIAALDTVLAASSRTHYKALERMRP